MGRILIARICRRGLLAPVLVAYLFFNVSSGLVEGEQGSTGAADTSLGRKSKSWYRFFLISL